MLFDNELNHLKKTLKGSMCKLVSMMYHLNIQKCGTSWWHGQNVAKIACHNVVPQFEMFKTRGYF
jgi:hypothetical protein